MPPPPSPGTYFVFLDVCPTTVLTGFECAFFDLPIIVLGPASFGYGDLALTSQNNASSQIISGTVRTFGHNEAVTIDFAGSITNVVTQALSDARDGNKTFTLTVPNLPAGKYPVTATNSSGSSDKELFTIIAGTDTFVPSISPQTLPAITQGALSEKATFTIQVVGTGLTACDGVASIELFGLPPGITGVFGSGVFSQFPTTTLSIPSGGQFNSTTLQLTASGNAFPGPINAFIQAGCGTEFHGTPLESAVLTGISFSDAGGGGIGFAGFIQFSEATVIISPLNVESGETVSISAYGYKPEDTPIMSIFKGTGSESVTPNSPLTFSAKGNFTVAQVTIPTISPGFYEFDVLDSDGTFGTAPFTVLSSTDTFTMSVSPGTIVPIPAVKQGESQDVVVTISAITGKTPGNVDINLFGLPPGMNIAFDGVTSASKSLTLGLGATKPTTLTFSPSVATPSGFYFIELEADDGTNIRFVDLEIFVLPGGALADSFTSFRVSPPFGIAGDTVTFEGFGFTTGDDVTLTFAGETITTTGKTFDASFQFNMTSQVPSTLITEGRFPARPHEVFLLLLLYQSCLFLLFHRMLSQNQNPTHRKYI